MSKENYKKSFTILTKNELDLLKAAYTEGIQKFFNEIVKEEKIFDILGDDFKTFYKKLLSDIESAEKEQVKGIRTKFDTYKKLKTHLDHLIISSYLDNLTDEGFENLRKALEDFGADNNIEIISNFLQHKKEYAESLKAKDEKALSQTVPQGLKAPFTKLQFGEAQKLKIMSTPEVERFFEKFSQNGKVIDILDGEFASFYDDIRNEKNFPGNDRSIVSTIAEKQYYENLKIHLEYVVVPAYLENLTKQDIQNFQETILQFGKAHDIKTIEEFFAYTDKRIQAAEEEEKLIAGGSMTKKPADSISEGDKKKNIKKPVKLKFSEICYFKKYDIGEVLKIADKSGISLSELNDYIFDILDDEFKSFYKGLKNPDQLFVNPEKEYKLYFKRSKEIFDSFIDSYLDNLELDGVKSHLEEIKIFGEENNIDLIKKFVDEKEKYILNLAKIEASLKTHNSSFFFSDKTKASANQDEVIITNSTLGKEKENNINAGIKNSSVEQLVSPAEPQLSELQKLQNQTKEEQIEFFSLAFTKLLTGKPTFNFLSDDFQNFCKQSSDLHIKLWLKRLILLYIEKKLQSLSPSDLTKLEELIEGFKIGHKEVQIESSGNKAHEVTSNTYPHEDSEPEHTPEQTEYRLKEANGDTLNTHPHEDSELEYTPERNERWLKEAERFTNASEQECLDILANLEKSCLIEKWLQNKDKKFFAGKESFLINYAFKQDTVSYGTLNFCCPKVCFVRI